MERLAWRTSVVLALALFGDSLAERPQVSSSVLQSVEVRAHGHFQKRKDTENTTAPDCLCSFDIDRTLTGKQGETRTCSRNKVYRGVHDPAYSKGDLTLSELGQNIGKTFCRKCYIAFVSAGTGGGKNSQERATLIQQAKASGGTLISEKWTGPSVDRENRRHCDSNPKWYWTTLVVGCEDGSKQEAIKGILKYLSQNKHVTIEPSRVYHYDDRISNIESFKGTGFNSRQISCRYPEGDIGLCGAQLREVEESKKGLNACPCGNGGPVWNTRAGDAPNTCGSRIDWVKKNKKVSDEEARKTVADEFTDECGECVKDPTPSPTASPTPSPTPSATPSVTPSATPESTGQPTYETFDNKRPRCSGDVQVDRADFGSPKEMSPDECKSWCSQEEECECVTYDKNAKKCWLAKHCGKETWEDNSDYTIYQKQC